MAKNRGARAQGGGGRRIVDWEVEGQRVKDRAGFGMKYSPFRCHDEAPLCGSDFPDEFLERVGENSKLEQEARRQGEFGGCWGLLKRRGTGGGGGGGGPENGPPSLNEISHSRLIREISPWNEFYDSS